MSDTSLPPSLARLLPTTAGIDDTGTLTIGGCSVTDLAERFGTPLFVYDERHLRETMQRYRKGLSSRWPISRVCFASKSLPCVAAYAIAEAEGLSVDVAGEGELRMALAAGVTPANIVLHGNAKSSAEISLATKVGVGLIVVDNDHDAALIEKHATAPQDVLIRVLPEVEADTHPSIQTGGAHSKFGMPVDVALTLIEQLKQSVRVRVRGVHVHIGSQILDIEPFLDALRVIANVGNFDVYNLGGGLGVNYSEADDAPEIEEYLDELCGLAKTVLPDDVELIIEPGRSLVARSGITAYTVRTVKHSLETFVAVDGGMSELMNIALTDDRFTAAVANRVSTTPDSLVQLVGRQCESGDLLIDRAQLHAPVPGDTVVIAATGAYGYTFANNYNGALHPAVVFCRDGEATLAVRRQTYEGYLEAHEPALKHDWARLSLHTTE